MLTRILYVDDDDDIRSVAVFALEVVGGFQVAACASGPEALARALDFAPQLLLLDVMMPELDGPATLAALRQDAATAATPAIFMTAKVQRTEVDRLLALGAADVIAKPFDPMALPDTIRAIWERVACSSAETPP
jgi:two-component system, OmpR family, response regulator